MALVTGNIVTVAPSKGNAGLKQYQTGDAAAVVEANGYFDAAAALFQTGDVLLAIMSDATKHYKVTRSGTDITLSTGSAIS